MSDQFKAKIAAKIKQIAMTSLRVQKAKEKTVQTVAALKQMYE